MAILEQGLKYYFCACPACSWKGKKPHWDGQCPVCGNALEIQIRERRHSSDLSCKVILSGLSTDPKVGPLRPDFSILSDRKIFGESLKNLLKAGESIRASLAGSIARLGLPHPSVRRKDLRFRKRD